MMSDLNREMTHDGSAIQIGMSQNDVKQIMGERVIIGYEKSKEKADQFVPITLQNPYRSEVLKSHGTTYEIFFYFTYLKHADGVITDDELTPLVFENNKLIGKGWKFLEDLKNQ